MNLRVRDKSILLPPAMYLSSFHSLVGIAIHLCHET